MAPGKFEPVLEPEERQILYEPGAYTSGRSWRLGHLRLTNKRLLFSQSSRTMLEIALPSIKDVRIQKRPFALANKPCLALSYIQGARGSSREVWLATGDIENWRDAILALQDGQKDRAKTLLDHPFLSRGGDPREVGSVLRREKDDLDQARRDRVRQILVENQGRDRAHQIQPGDIAKIAGLIDRRSAKLLWYVWKNRHARLDELKTLLDETCHMNVLIRIRETINPTARRLLGKPILIFERSRLDHWSGDQVLFSWWVNEEAPGEAASTTLADVFDEGDHYMIILELGSVSEEDIRLIVEGNRLVVAVDTAGRRYYEEIAIPAAADPGSLSKAYRNGLLQVSLGKA